MHRIVFEVDDEMADKLAAIVDGSTKNRTATLRQLIAAEHRKLFPGYYRASTADPEIRIKRRRAEAQHAASLARVGPGHMEEHVIDFKWHRLAIIVNRHTKKSQIIWLPQDANYGSLWQGERGMEKAHGQFTRKEVAEWIKANPPTPSDAWDHVPGSRVMVGA